MPETDSLGGQTGKEREQRWSRKKWQRTMLLVHVQVAGVLLGIKGSGWTLCSDAEKSKNSVYRHRIVEQSKVRERWAQKLSEALRV